MTKVFLKQRYLVVDENGREFCEIARTQGKGALISGQLWVCDAGGTELARLHAQTWRKDPRYELLRGEVKEATIKKTGFMLTRFAATTVEGIETSVAGDWLGREYEFTCNARLVGSLTRRWLKPQRTYDLDLELDVDAIPILITSVVIDQHRLQEGWGGDGGGGGG